MIIQVVTFTANRNLSNNDVYKLTTITAPLKLTTKLVGAAAGIKLTTVTAPLELKTKLVGAEAGILLLAVV